LLPLPTNSKSLGVIFRQPFDGHLRFYVHASAVAKARNYHTGALRHTCCVLPDDVAGSRLDCCNSLLIGAPAATTNKQQQAQNSLVQAVAQPAHQCSVTPLSQRFHLR
jgi:hypothetical protein